MPAPRRLVSTEALELLADAYATPESGMKRTASGIKASYDGAMILFALLDEMRQVRLYLERLTGDGKSS